ncbi:hypothetical protein ACLMJK_004744 [Lecanora helva]
MMCLPWLDWLSWLIRHGHSSICAKASVQLQEDGKSHVFPPNVLLIFMRSGLQRLCTSLSSPVRNVVNRSIKPLVSNSRRRLYSAVAVRHLPHGTTIERPDSDHDSHGFTIKYQASGGGRRKSNGQWMKDRKARRNPQETTLAVQLGNLRTVQVQPHGKKEPDTAEIVAAKRSDSKSHKKEWIKFLSTFEQYQYESDIDAAQADRPLLIKHKLHGGDWRIWLLLIRFRERHYGAQSTQQLFRVIFKKGMLMPTSGDLGRELWDLLIKASQEDSEFLDEAISYAVKVKEITGKVWPQLYYNVIANALKTNSTKAYSMHCWLKDAFPPSSDDYRKLFRRCCLWNKIGGFERIYMDLPLSGLYSVVVPELCHLQKYGDALNWHHLLVANNDPPSNFAPVQPLLAHLIHKDNNHELEKIADDLNKACGTTLPVPLATEEYIKQHTAVGREILNRRLGEIHGVSPKHLSDQFCARLFATRIFSVDAIISGLQMVAIDTIGPLTMREIAIRDEYDTVAICSHIARMKEGGTSPAHSVYCEFLHHLALEDKKALLESLAKCDVHPDAFEDLDLQENLLRQYYERNDHLQVERTLVAITLHCRKQDLLKWRTNLILRCQISLGRKDAVTSMMDSMKRQNIPITARTSRHLRVCWLSSRQPGQGPVGTQELTIIMNTSLRTLHSGRYVPITAWREILRRLGMDGRLEEFENLALILVDHYTNPISPITLPTHFNLKKDPQPRNKNPQAHLKNLFTIAAQHAIVAWGFQHEAKSRPKIYRIQAQSPDPSSKQQQTLWTWGLLLLRHLQERGVPIHRATVARICRIRLRILFGPGISRRRVNRRMRAIRENRGQALDRRALMFHMRGMKRIWGEDLFQQRGLGFKRIEGRERRGVESK